MKQALILSLGIFMFLTACKKDEDPSLKGKWNVENNILKIYSGGTTVTETQPGNGATMDFQENGNLILTDSSGPETLQYKILSASKVIIDEDTFDIKNLTASSVTLFAHEDLSADEYDEVNVNLKR
jgi:hypothetical protein